MPSAYKYTPQAATLELQFDQLLTPIEVRQKAGFEVSILQINLIMIIDIYIYVYILLTLTEVSPIAIAISIGFPSVPVLLQLSSVEPDKLISLKF